MTWESEVLADSPVLFVACDEGTGQPTDSSSNALTLTFDYGTASWVNDSSFVDHPSGRPVLVGGQGSWSTDLASPLMLGDCSFEMLVRMVDPGTSNHDTGMVLPSDWVGDGLQFSVQSSFDWATGNLAASADSVNRGVSYGFGATVEDWQHLVIVSNADGLELWVNGSLENSSAYPAPLTLSSTDSITFGNLYEGFSESDDLLAGIAVYDSALTPERIAAHHAAALGGGVEPPLPDPWYPQAIADGPVAYWPLQGDFLDYSVNGHDAQQVVRTTEYDSNSAVGNGHYWTATGGPGTPLVNVGSSNWTACLSYRDTTAAGAPVELILGDPLGAYISVMVSSWGVNVSESYGFPDLASYATPTQDTDWHHVAVTWDGTDLVVYWDGAQVATAAYAGTTVDIGAWVMASESEGGSRVAEVAILKQAISAVDIGDYHAASLADTATGYEALVLTDLPETLWMFDDGAGDPQDSSGNDNHLQLVWFAPSFEADDHRGLAMSANGMITATLPGVPTGAVTLEVAVRLTDWDDRARLSAEFRGDSTANVNLYGQWAFTDELGSWNGGVRYSSGGGSSGDYEITDPDPWVLLAVTADEDGYSFYVDGVLDESWPNTYDDTLKHMLAGSGAAFQIGGLYGGIAIYDKVLSPERLDVHAQAFHGLIAPPDDIDVLLDVVEIEVGGGAVGSATPGIPPAVPPIQVGGSTLPVPTPTFPPGGAPGWKSTWGEPIEINRPLNGTKTATIHVPESSGQPTLVTGELDVTRNGHRHFVGPVLDLDDDTANGHLIYRARSDWWYFSKRYAGSAQRESHLVNGYFENWASEPWLGGWTGWNVIAESEEDIVLSGVASVRLVNFSEDEETQSHFDSAFAKTTQGNGFPFFVSGWCYIVGDFEPGHRTLGMRCYWDDGKVKREATTFIDHTHPRDTWVRHYLEIQASPNTTGLFVVQLWCPRGTVIWDHIQVVGNTYTGSEHPIGGDQAQLAGEFVRDAQEGKGKADLGIGRNTPETGVIVPDLMRHYRHEQVAGKIEGMTQRDDSFDFDIVTDGSTKTFTTFYPRRGKGAPALNFPGNVVRYRRTVLGSLAESSVLLLGESNDPAREEGAAWDEGALGGKMLEGVHQAPQETPIGALAPTAQKYLEKAMVPPQAIDAVVKGDDVDNYEEGDTVTMNATRGAASWSGEYRIVNWKADCPNDEVTLSLELFTEDEG